jgi:3-methyladenine DNA glycosylase AlkC
LHLIDKNIERRIQRDIVSHVLPREYASAIENVPRVLKVLYTGIPENKRLSFGRVYTIQLLSKYLFSSLSEIGADVYEFAVALFEGSEDFQTKGTALGILSFCGIDDYVRVLPFFNVSASSDSWDMREFAQMFFRKLINRWPDEMKKHLVELARSENPNCRRFVSETLRPVKENRWFYRNPDYPLSILRNMLRESSDYPRTSVGNNLSDLARHLPDLVFDLVKELAASGNRNSYWIAYRACRNLVKKEPARVMSLLQIDEYRYKKKVYRRSENSRN